MLVIVHGWSDSADSFDHIANRLSAAVPGLDIAHIVLANYVSLDDVVTLPDLRVAMQAAWLAKGLPTGPRSIDVIVHSTGALVVRDWMTSYFTPETNPIKRLVMLAPANFGSPLATMGRSFIGRVIKGFNFNEPFQTGTQVLKGLELASPYSWQLAMRDRFDPEHTWYGPGKILCSVLVGTAGFTGISAIANRPGSDGCVRVSTANLNPVLIAANFFEDPQHPVFETDPADPHDPIIPYQGRTAFLRIPGENHGTMAQGGNVATTLGHIVAALQIEDAGFDAYCDQLDQASAAARAAEAGNAYTHGYQNTVVHLTDDLDFSVTDYLIEAYVPKAGATVTPDDVDQDATKSVQETILVDAHTYSDDGSYRALLFDCTELQKQLTTPQRNLEMSVTAHPQVKSGSAGYQTFGYDDIGGILLAPNAQSLVFEPDRTVLIEMRIKRVQVDIFAFRGAVAGK